MSIKPLTQLKPRQKYWTFNPAYGESAKIRFDIVRTGSLCDPVIKRQKWRLLMGLCFASEEDALQAKRKMLSFKNQIK